MDCHSIGLKLQTCPTAHGLLVHWATLDCTAECKQLNQSPRAPREALCGSPPHIRTNNCTAIKLNYSFHPAPGRSTKPTLPCQIWFSLDRPVSAHYLSLGRRPKMWRTSLFCSAANSRHTVVASVWPGALSDWRQTETHCLEVLVSSCDQQKPPRLLSFQAH